MDTFEIMINLVKQEDWSCFRDVKDAYMHILMEENHRKNLRFLAEGNQCLQFKAPSFGTPSTRKVFTKVLFVEAG